MISKKVEGNVCQNNTDLRFFSRKYKQKNHAGLTNKMKKIEILSWKIKKQNTRKTKRDMFSI